MMIGVNQTFIFYFMHKNIGLIYWIPWLLIKRKINYLVWYPEGILIHQISRCKHCLDWS